VASYKKAAVARRIASQRHPARQVYRSAIVVSKISSCRIRMRRQKITMASDPTPSAMGYQSSTDGSPIQATLATRHAHSSEGSKSDAREAQSIVAQWDEKY
jgi:hypothetical protein